MSELSREKRQVILSNILACTFFERGISSKPRVFLVDDRETVEKEMSDRNLKGIGVFTLNEDEIFTPNDHPSFADKTFSLKELNFVVRRLRHFGMVSLTVILCKGINRPKHKNQPYLFISTNWDTFDSKEYLFECRSMLVGQETA